MPLDSQLGKDAAALVTHYFPGSTITSIRSEYHRGVFIGDFSIALACTIDHPFLQQVRIGFNNTDVPGMYQEDLEKWCDTHDDGMLYGHVETPDMFIIATELMSHSHEEMEQTAKLLAVQARAKIEQEQRDWEEIAKSDNPPEEF